MNWFGFDTKQNEFLFLKKKDDLRNGLIFSVQCAYKQCKDIDAEALQV